MCDDIQSTLPDNYVTTDVRARLQRLGALQPLNTSLRREIDHMQTVISTVSQSITSLRQFADGQSVYHDELMELFDAVHDARVPSAWTKVYSQLVKSSRYCSCKNRNNRHSRCIVKI